MSIPIYVINLKGSTARWEAVSASAASVGASLKRVEAVDGRQLLQEHWRDFDGQHFLRWHGRTPLGSEYGCYMSHLKALEQIVANRDPFAVILEDDARFEPDFAERVEAIVSIGPQIGIVKFFNHRMRGFVPKLRTARGDRLGRCLHGPLGSALGYLVTCETASKLLSGLRPMQLPYDIALGRYWIYQVPFHTTEFPLVTPDRTGTETTIGTREVYRKTKLPKFKRLGALKFRACDYIRGVWGALRRR
ncbi:glycosyltransferase family 25 protein [Limoniibacter endophyticus]|uniref:Glycosyl transferase family 25 n=1 Tax=Limoniibacter endophyticus TaxID=1565040 RepID=A0A8J3GG11_9HYPH|nr:glycosyltransferase family 25 protein [Limoniibacter endophyticus]GHC65915.1 glycosyl transferase family 25 [Limoniibacter endophyticus]